MRDNRASSFSASFFTSSGIPAASIFCFSSSVSRWLSSCSPIPSGSPSSARADSSHAETAVPGPALALDLGAHCCTSISLARCLFKSSTAPRSRRLQQLCLSSVVRNGATSTKSTSRLGSSILAAIVRNSSKASATRKQSAGTAPPHSAPALEARVGGRQNIFQRLHLGHHERLGLRIAHQPYLPTPSVNTNLLWLAS